MIYLHVCFLNDEQFLHTGFAAKLIYLVVMEKTFCHSVRNTGCELSDLTVRVLQGYWMGGNTHEKKGGGGVLGRDALYRVKEHRVLSTAE